MHNYATVENPGFSSVAPPLSLTSTHRVDHSTTVGALALLVGTVASVVAEGRLTLVAFAAFLATVAAAVFLVSRRLGRVE